MLAGAVDAVDERDETGHERQRAGDVEAGEAGSAGGRPRDEVGDAAASTTPIGTLTKKIHSQLSSVVITPPSRTPTATPALPMAPHTPRATVR